VKILVTGATGFLGTALVERLLARGETDLRCFLRSGSDHARLDALGRRYPAAKLELYVGSLASRESAARALEGVGVVYHLAASLLGAAADIFLNTVVASKHLLEAIQDGAASGPKPRPPAEAIAAVPERRPIKVVLVSSFGVYGVASLPRGHVVDESTPFEPHPERRDLYSQAKLRQEKLFREYQARLGFPLVVLRPGVIYGPRGSRISARVGLDLMGLFLHLGGDNRLPLTYVDNCAEAIAVAGQSEQAEGQTYNVVDDDLPTCGQYLARYRREVKPLRAVRIPYLAMHAISVAVQRYHAFSKGQLPAIFTPYKTATSWKGNRFDNAKLKSLGWKPLVPTEEGLRRAFEDFRANPK
jgi:nucleoside-diphosphate-sugar epimerase